MWIQRLHLHHFRSYEQATFTFSPEMNLITGDNAAGKTTILEAIHVLITGRSFRTRSLSELIHYGSPSFTVQAEFVRHDLSQTLTVSSDGKQRTILRNETKQPNIASLFGILQGVVLTPDDAQLIKGAPQKRRQFLDLHLAQSDPLYIHHLSRYYRALRQRNHLLKNKQLPGIEAWEQQLAISAAYVTEKRLDRQKETERVASDLYQSFSSDDPRFSIDFQSRVARKLPELSVEQFFLSEYEKTRPRELLFGKTLIGPQRDDFVVRVREKEARLFCSEGEQRSCAMALRFAEWRRMKEQFEESPLLLVDDFGVSLDRRRQVRLSQLLDSKGQVFVTATERPSDLQGHEIQLPFHSK